MSSARKRSRAIPVHSSIYGQIQSIVSAARNLLQVAHFVGLIVHLWHLTLRKALIVFKREHFVTWLVVLLLLSLLEGLLFFVLVVALVLEGGSLLVFTEVVVVAPWVGLAEVIRGGLDHRVLLGSLTLIFCNCLICV